MYSNKQLYDKIVNPYTGKQVKINSSKGKKIVKNYLSIINFNGGSKYNINTIKEIAGKFNNIKPNDIQNFLNSLDKMNKKSSSSMDVFEKIIKWVSFKEGFEIKKYINPDTFLNIFKDYQIGGSGRGDRERERDIDRDRERERDIDMDRERQRGQVNRNVLAQQYNYNGELIYHGQHLEDLRQRVQANAEEAQKYKIGAAIGSILLFVLWYWTTSDNSN